MTFFQQIERVQFIYRLIKLERTGEPEVFASRRQISRRQLYNLLDEFKDLGAEIAYSRKRETFFFVRPFVFHINIKVEALSKEELTNYNGGSALFFLPCKDIARNEPNFALVI